MRPITTSSLSCTSCLTPAPRAPGKAAVKALTSPAYAKLKNVPKVASEEEATQLLLSIIPFAFFLRVERGAPSGSSASSPKTLQITQMQTFVPSDYYAWFYEGSQLTTYLGGVAMVAVMLAGVMFPLWPPIMRLGVWYLSIAVLGLIGLFFALAVVRLIFYIITVIVASPGIWIFPKLFADVGFVSRLAIMGAFPVPRVADRSITHFRSNPSFPSGNGICPKRRPRRSAARSPRRAARRASPPPFPQRTAKAPLPQAYLHASKKFPTRKTPAHRVGKHA